MKEVLEQFKIAFEAKLTRYICCISGAEEPVGEACRYALLTGGKRIRPLLAYLGAELMRATGEKVDNIAVAVECVHNYSLVHDDLPCMDDDSMRHGKLSTHAKFGEGMGVLTGDALLNLAMEILMDNSDIDNNYIKAVRIFLRNSGIHGMIGGQCIDLIKEGAAANIQEIIKLNELKTSCLFKAALVSSAVACGANAEEQALLERFCDKLGLIFQLVDDILDVESTVEELGKNIGSDIECNKTTYLSLIGMEQTKKDIIGYELEAIECLRVFGDRADNLIKLTKYLTSRTA